MEDWEDILDNKEVFRKVVSEGQGSKPVKGDVVVVRVDVEEQVSFRCPINQGFLPDLFEIVLLLMKEGEECMVKTNERFEVKTFSIDNKKIQGSRNFIIKLVSIEDVGDFDEKDFIKIAHKRGNEYFNEGETAKARLMYSYCVQHGVNKEECVTYKANICACYQKELNWDELIKVSEEVNIDDCKDPFVVAKLLCRRGIALFKKKRYHKALETLNQALEYDSENKHILEQINQTQQASDRDEIKQRKFYKAMMQSMYKKEPKVPLKKITNSIIICSIAVIIMAIIFSYYDILLTSN